MSASLASLVVSLIAVSVALITLWKTHFTRFNPLTASGALTFRIFDFSRDNEAWFIRSYAVAIAVTNAGARPGVVNAFRLRLHADGIDGFEQLVPAVFELDQAKTWRRGGDRNYWIDEAILADIMPFVVLPKTTVVRYVAFELATAEAFVSNHFQIDLEIQIADKWRHVTTWFTSCDQAMWNTLAPGQTVLTVRPDGYVVWSAKRA